jgi:tRNA(adenine34) deaminase
MSLNLYTYEYFMKEALKEARKAFDKDEIPVGAVVVCNNQIIARAHNSTETLNDVTAHAEMLAFTAASDYLGGKYLTDCILYVTLEPCVMCAGASYWTQISKLVYGARDEKRGFQKMDRKILHPSTTVLGGILENECRHILQDFFEKKRN